MKSLPSGPWEVLFQRALRLVDDIQRHGGLADPFWTFGGGTVLMFRYGHRLSKDIDIFVPDPQYLGYVTPRLSDTAASLTEEYTEMPGSFVKLQFEEGEIDFVAAPNLTDGAWEQWDIQGRPVRVETAAEVIAKKMFHRGDRATARDLFDLAMQGSGSMQRLARQGWPVRTEKAMLETIAVVLLVLWLLGLVTSYTLGGFIHVLLVLAIVVVLLRVIGGRRAL